MKILPFRYRELSGQTLITSEGGDFGFFDSSIILSILENSLSTEEEEKLLSMRVIAPSLDDWRVKSLSLQTHQKYHDRQRSIRYLMVIPTLRCDLACTYCQVSRAPENAKGFDWDERHLEALNTFIKSYAADKLKIEFQGGEVSLRSDMIAHVEKIAEEYCSEIELVACTNLYEIRPEFEKFFQKDNFYISTSLDGDIDAMARNRTGNKESASRNISNIRYIIEKYGSEKISLLPTITRTSKSEAESLIDLYASLGASGIFLRPVNFMGFARKRHDEATDGFSKWQEYFLNALEHIKSLNNEIYFEEVYVADLVRKIFGGEKGAFIDFRSPANFLQDLAVIDFDGTVYPTDEARMLTRTRHVDLSVGDIFSGLDEEKIETLNMDAVNETHPDCIHCAYLPFCGVDIIDDLSRYGRIDLPKSETWFCNKQTFFFDWIFDKVRRQDVVWLQIFSKWLHRKARPSLNLDIFLA
jgi:His-Xaa-Ser system radical SAM maturase HxsB